MPYRIADVDDLVTNTTGAAVGRLLGVVAVHLLPSAVPPSAPASAACAECGALA